MKFRTGCEWGDSMVPCMCLMPSSLLVMHTDADEDDWVTRRHNASLEKDPMHDLELTRLLNAAVNGSDGSEAELVDRIHDHLRHIALRAVSGQHRSGTLGATALVNEIWLRVVSSPPDEGWNGRGHFFGSAARAMRNLLIDQARKRKRLGEKLGIRMDLRDVDVATPTSDETLLAIDDALKELADRDPLMVRLVELKFFAGMTMAAIAADLDLPLRTVENRWTHAKAWLRASMTRDRSANAKNAPR